MYRAENNMLVWQLDGNRPHGAQGSHTFSTAFPLARCERDHRPGSEPWSPALRLQNAGHEIRVLQAEERQGSGATWPVAAARNTWEQRNSFTGWLYRIAINASIDRYRRGSKLRTASMEDVVETRLHNSATVRPSRSPLDRLHDKERRRMLEAAVRKLPERQREVVALRYFGELRLEEIAETLGCPLGTVKSNLHKAVLALKHMLMDQEKVLSYE